MSRALMTAPAEKAEHSSKRVTLRIELLTQDEAVQARAGLDEKTVEAYAELMREGVEFPALAVFDDGTNLWLADGFHRAAAAARASIEDFACEVRQGTRRDAALHSIAANARHGLQRSWKDKRRAVEMLFRDEEWSKWSDEELARLAGVSNTFVTKMRRKLQPEAVGRPVLVRRGTQVYLKKPRGAGRRPRTERAPSYISGWLYYLVRFTPEQFVKWRMIVRGRTSVSVVSEAVDIVMRESASRP